MNERVSNEQAQGYIDGELATFKRLKVRRQDVKDIRLNAFEDLLDARRQRDEAGPVLEAARRLNSGRFSDWPSEHLAEALIWALRWGPPEWEAEVSAAIAIRAYDAAHAAAREAPEPTEQERHDMARSNSGGEE
jgi:hypothetical protein